MEDKSTLDSIKIIGKIDLDAINQRTRPEKKSRRKLAKERKERAQKLQAASDPSSSA